MNQINHSEPQDEYNTSIKDIAGIKDYSLIFNIINAHFSDPDSTEAKITDQNEFDIRAAKTRTKVSWAINKSILLFVNDAHKDIVSQVFQDHIPLQDKKFAFLWHFCLNNRLFREITVNVFAKIYFSGRAQISKEDIIGYIKHISDKDDPSKPNWSEETIYRLATKYLSLMTKFDFVADNRVKSFNHIRPSPEAITIFLYFSKAFSPNSRNILENPLLAASFISTSDIQDRLKKLSLKGYVGMDFNGVALNVDFIHSNKDICDALYRRS